MSLPYYKRFPRDFLEGTIGLSFEVKGAYAIVLDLIYMRDGRLPDDARFIAGQLGCSVRKWSAIREELIARGKLQVHEGIISNFRADYLTEETRSYQDKQREMAGKPRKNNAQRQPEPSQSEPEAETDTNVSVARAARVRPESDFEKFWSAYPAKIGRKAAERSWSKAKDRPPLPEVIAALETYRRTKPADREWCNPATWLNQGRWADAPGETPAASGGQTAPATFNAPAVRASIVKAKDEDFARRWIDHYCRWEGDDRRLLARTSAVASRLQRDLAAWASANRVTIEVATANDEASPLPHPKDQAA